MNNDKDIKINSIPLYNKDLIKKQIFDCIFLKVIEMNESFLLGIDHDYIIYKIYKNNNKVNKIDELYTLILIKDYTLSKEDEIFNTLAINENSYIYTFENSFYDSVLNDLTVLYLNIIDLVDPIENSYYDEIALEINYIQKINYTFNIKKKYEYFIINTKIDFFYNYYPITIKLINNKKIDSFKVILYFGILNKINCFLNVNANNNKCTYSLEYFYFNFKFNLPEYHKEIIDEIIYDIKESDVFNNKARKRFVIINSTSNKLTEIFYIKKQERDNEEKRKNQEKKKKKKKKKKKRIKKFIQLKI